MSEGATQIIPFAAIKNASECGLKKIYAAFVIFLCHYPQLICYIRMMENEAIDATTFEQKKGFTSKSRSAIMWSGFDE